MSFGKVVFLGLPSEPGCGLVPETERAFGRQKDW
jgi:hypothetical protein